MFRALSIVATLVVALSTLTALSQPAAAHEHRTVGPYELEVGWLVEPALAGQMNAVFLEVTDTRVSPEKPVEGLAKTLTVEVFAGGLTRGHTPQLRPRSGEPGAYVADIIPTREGSYRFKITGTIESQDVNETFESGPGRFDDIRPATSLQYPEAVLGGADLSRTLNDLRSATDQTRLAALAALVLGVAALVLALRPRRT